MDSWIVKLTNPPTHQSTNYAIRKDGAEDWNRTSDTSIFSAVLYQLSYLGLPGRGLEDPDHSSAAEGRTSPPHLGNWGWH